jgi:hypothetical protein
MMTKTLRRSKGPGHLRDLLVYCAIGVLVASVAIFLGVHSARVGEPVSLADKWVGFALMTVAVFGYSIKRFKADLHQARYWFGLSALAIAHCGIGVVALSRLPSMPLINFAVGAVFEYFAVSACMEWFLNGRKL